MRFKRSIFAIVGFAMQKKRPILIALASIVVVGAGVFGVIKLLETPEPEPMLTVSVDHPGEAEPELKRNYFEPNYPMRIALPSIEAEGLVQRVGLDQNGQVTWPDNIHLAGWFANKQRPGEKGVALIGGHTAGISTDGVFKKLGELKADHEITIEFGDGSQRKFQVVSVKSYGAKDLTEQLFKPHKDVEAQLNLVTYNFTDTNAQRTLVVSKLVE